MSKHTPGPWKLCHHLQSAEQDQSCPCAFPGNIWGGDGEKVVCTIGPHCPEVIEGADMIPRYDRAAELANAHLIAAAPEMYISLKFIMATYKANREKFSLSKGEVENKEAAAFIENLDYLTGHIEAAIAKAEGKG